MLGAKGVATDFADVVIDVVVRDFWRIIVILLPTFVYALLARPVAVSWKLRWFGLVLALAGYLGGFGIVRAVGTDAERLTKKLCEEKYGHEFLFITDYDAKERAFYHMRDENGVPQGYDLIWRGVEITTGAQREHRHDVLLKQAEEKGLAKDVEFYLQFFKYGCPPHGGFGIGIDRLTMLFLGLSIKEVQFLFRGPNRLTP